MDWYHESLKYGPSRSGVVVAMLEDLLDHHALDATCPVSMAFLTLALERLVPDVIQHIRGRRCGYYIQYLARMDGNNTTAVMISNALWG